MTNTIRHEKREPNYTPHFSSLREPCPRKISFTRMTSFRSFINRNLLPRIFISRIVTSRLIFLWLIDKPLWHCRKFRICPLRSTTALRLAYDCADNNGHAIERRNDCVTSNIYQIALTTNCRQHEENHIQLLKNWNNMNEQNLRNYLNHYHRWQPRPREQPRQP